MTVDAISPDDLPGARPRFNKQPVKRLRLPSTTMQHQHKAGHPKFVPTPDQRKIVRVMVAASASHEYIRQQIINPATLRPISNDLLRSEFADDLKYGLEELKVNNSMTLFKMAQGYQVTTETVTEVPAAINPKTGLRELVMKKETKTRQVPPDLGAAIWIDKTRNGQREGAPLPNLGPDGQPIAQGGITQVVLVLPANGRNDRPLHGVIEGRAQQVAIAPPVLDAQPQPQGKPVGLSLPSNGRS